MRLLSILSLFRVRERWFADHKKYKSFPIWYQFPSFHHSTDQNKENLFADAQSWLKSYQSLMNSEHGRHVFSQYLARNLADEYFLFWHAVEISKRETDTAKLRPIVKEIFSVFIASNAPLCINVDKKVRSVISSKMNLEYLDLEDIFDTAQKYAEQIMKNTYYPDFLKSDMYSDLLKELSGNVLM